MIINKQTMQKETKQFLEVLFHLPEVEQIAIKGVEIASIEDDESINKGVALCYHDRFSDLDISIMVRINPVDYYGDKPLYDHYLPRLQFGERFMGMTYSTCFHLGMHEEQLRICLKTGFRMDLLCCIQCDEKVSPLPIQDRRERTSHKQEGNLWEDLAFEKIEKFWFVSVMALGKLMRKDYLIADHLSHMLLMESLVIQMELRDNLYQITWHRYGYEDEIEYLDVDLQEAQLFIVEQDTTYNRISEQLYRAVVSYDKLAQRSNPAYESCLQVFMEIWKAYIA